VASFMCILVDIPYVPRWSRVGGGSSRLALSKKYELERLIEVSKSQCESSAAWSDFVGKCRDP
jgi:hypothetical protein